MNAFVKKQSLGARPISESSFIRFRHVGPLRLSASAFKRGKIACLGVEVLSQDHHATERERRQQVGSRWIPHPETPGKERGPRNRLWDGEHVAWVTHRRGVFSPK